MTDTNYMLNKAKFTWRNVSRQFLVFFMPLGAITMFFFSSIQTNVSTKKYHRISKATIGYLWMKCQEILIFIMCHEFLIWLDLSGHFLLNCGYWSDWSIKLQCYWLSVSQQLGHDVLAMKTRIFINIIHFVRFVYCSSNYQLSSQSILL